MNHTIRNKTDWTVVQMLEWATGYFREKKVPSPRLSIEWLVAHVLQMKRLDLYLQFDRPLTSKELNRLRPLVLRRAEHEPLQYITGSTYFYNLPIMVTPDVLIPRPETEELVEIVLANHSGERNLRVLDIGTGSGCIALALKKARPSWQITGIDISEKALSVARENSDEANLDVEFHHSGFAEYDPDQKMDIVISNPPYIEVHEIETLSDQVYRYEPKIALITDNVIDVYRQLYQFSKRFLTPSGSFYFEINEALGEKMLDICNIQPLSCKILQDYSGKERFIIGKFE